MEPVVSRLGEDGDRGPRTPRPLRRGHGAPFWLGAREQRSGRGGGELQAQTPGVGDGPHQHGWLPEVREEGYSITHSVRPDFITTKFSWARHSAACTKRVMTHFKPTHITAMKNMPFLFIVHLTKVCQKVHKNTTN